MQVRRTLGDVLREAGMITASQLVSSLKEQNKTGEPLSTILIRKGYVTEQEIVDTLTATLGIPTTRLDPRMVEAEAMGMLPSYLIWHYQILPLTRQGQHLTLAMVDPLDEKAIEEVQNATGLEVVPVVVRQSDLTWAAGQCVFSSSSRMRREEARLDETSVVRVLDSLFVQAFQCRASDIHIQPEVEAIRIRFRVDGSLFDVLHLPVSIGPALVSRIKVMANLDISEKRLPQDGRIKLEIERHSIDLRVAVIPTVYGEQVVLRVLDQTRGILDIEGLRLESSNFERFMSLLACPHGILLVTGPTGSGKTTTLYTMLRFLNSPDRCIITLEDPVEYSLAGITQIQMNPRIGLTFSDGLRAVFRQDPDIIMVGEIRDTETAHLAVQAAMTGHLVLSTLHTNTAVGSITRLLDMGIEPYLICSSLRGVVAQRLVRMICSLCAEEYLLDEFTAVRIGMPELTGKRFRRGRGCHYCRMTGYQGRVAVQEVLVFNHDLRGMVMSDSFTEEELETAAREQGMTTLLEDGIRKAREGLTSLDEVMRVVYLGN
ncbi:MAG: type II/IV secretion system protein [Syntrophothermus sp.]|uniref:GspE/PulE family protein n=1 Tax=Syntrophothermus sp. TaxID=2736299 RepID=UPI00257BE9BB|nr:GspE/PulE family protein [Syntrophothermus sp.]NSW81855.1 type II/IV secretion system protein [Syntrophothermus sp.]